MSDNNYDEDSRKFEESVRNRPSHELKRIAREMGGDNYPMIVPFYTAYLNADMWRQYGMEQTWDRAKEYYESRTNSWKIFAAILFMFHIFRYFSWCILSTALRKMEDTMKKLSVLLVVLCFAATAKAAGWPQQYPQQYNYQQQYDQQYQQQQLEMQRRQMQQQNDYNTYQYEMQQRQGQGRTYDVPVRPYRSPSSLY